MSEIQLVPISDISESDLKKFYKIRYSDYVHQNFGGSRPSLEVHLNWAKKVKDLDHYQGFVITKNRNVIGGCSFKNISTLNLNAEFDIFISKEFSGKGFGRIGLEELLLFGFKNLGLHRIYAFLIESNQKALRMYKDFGFKEEGVMREHVCKNSEYLNSIIIGILKEEYEYHH